MREAVRLFLGNSVASCALVFLLFSALIRYWRHCLPGFRYTLPLRLAKVRLRASDCRALEFIFKACSPDELQLTKIESSIEAGHLGRLAELDIEARRRAAKQRVVGVRIVRAGAFVALSLIVAAVARLVWFQAYSVAGNSMLPTFESGDTVGARPTAPKLWGASGASPWIPKRGEIVIADNPTSQGEREVIKRVIGLPGDSIRFENGTLEINGWKVPRCDAGLYANVTAEFEPIQAHVVVEFLGDEEYLTLYEVTKSLPAVDAAYTVRPGEVFVLGDNRTSSSDSRAWGNLHLSQVRASVNWFLMGSKRNGTADFSRFLSRQHLRPSVAGVDITELVQRINVCRQQKPSKTSPPLGGSQALVAQLTQSQ